MGLAVPTPDEHVERDATIVALRDAITALPERQRLAMMLYLDADLSPSEIATALGVSAVAARKLLTKGATHLRTLLPEP